MGHDEVEKTDLDCINILIWEPENKKCCARCFRALKYKSQQTHQKAVEKHMSQFFSDEGQLRQAIDDLEEFKNDWKDLKFAVEELNKEFEPKIQKDKKEAATEKESGSSNANADAEDDLIVKIKQLALKAFQFELTARQKQLKAKQYNMLNVIRFQDEEKKI